MHVDAIEAGSHFINVTIGGGRPRPIQESFRRGKLGHHIGIGVHSKTLDQRLPGVGKFCQRLDALVVDRRKDGTGIDRWIGT